MRFSMEKEKGLLGRKLRKQVNAKKDFDCQLHVRYNDDDDDATAATWAAAVATCSRYTRPACTRPIAALYIYSFNKTFPKYPFSRNFN